MNVSATVPATIEIRRSRLLWLVGGVAVIAATATWALVGVAFDGGSSSVNATASVPLTSAAQDARKVPSIMALTPARLAAGALGTGYQLPTVDTGPTVTSVLASMSPATRRWTKSVTALTFRQLAAGAAGSP